MAIAVKIDLGSRYSQAFGIASDYTLPGLPGFFNKVEVMAPEQAVSMSKMGTPIYDILSLRSASDQYKFELPAMIRLGQSKVINRTPITGGEGEIIESFGNKSWAISIKGLLVDMDEHHYPEDQVEELLRFYEPNVPMSVSGKLLNLAGITDLYFMRIDLPPLEGFRDTQPFILNAYSYEPVDFYIKDDN